MNKRLKTLGIILTVAGLLFLTAGGVAYAKTQDGYDSLQALSEAQNVTLSYNEDGQLTGVAPSNGRNRAVEFDA